MAPDAWIVWLDTAISSVGRENLLRSLRPVVLMQQHLHSASLRPTEDAEPARAPPSDQASLITSSGAVIQQHTSLSEDSSFPAVSLMNRHMSWGPVDLEQNDARSARDCQGRKNEDNVSNRFKGRECEATNDLVTGGIRQSAPGQPASSQCRDLDGQAKGWTRDEIRACDRSAVEVLVSEATIRSWLSGATTTGKQCLVCFQSSRTLAS
jgi:hypothetical protein